MRKNFLAAGALCALVCSGFAAIAPAGAASSPIGSSRAVSGRIANIINPGSSETLSIGPWSVTLSSTTTVELRGGAPSDATALHIGDVVTAGGIVTVDHALAATDVRDLSLIDRANGIEGVIRNVFPLSGALTEMDIQTGKPSDDGFVARGIRLSVDVSASTPITLPDGTPGNISSLTLGRLVRVAGIYDSAARALVAPTYVRLLANPRDCDRENGLFCRHFITGRLVFEPSTTPPTFVNVRLGNGVVISVTVSTSTTILRRYDGPSNLGELALGDSLQLTGSFEQLNAHTFDASKIEDVSQQVAYTGAMVRLSSLLAGNMFGQGVVIHRDSGDLSPYRYGEVINLLFTGTTVVVRADNSAGTLADLGTLHWWQAVEVSGRYDRLSHTLIVMSLHL
jgi:hypothetical protein